MANAELRISNTLSKSDPTQTPVLIVGQTKQLGLLRYEDVLCKFGDKVPVENFEDAVKLLSSNLDICSLWMNQLNLAALPSKSSRHNAPSRSHSLTKIVKSNSSISKNETILIVCRKQDVFSLSSAVARALPIYTKKSALHKFCPTPSASGERHQFRDRVVTLEFFVTDGSLSDEDVSCLSSVALSIRHCAKLVDMPCSEMTTSDFINEVKLVCEDINIEPLIIRGDDLQKFGGIAGVGKAAVEPPALVVLSHKPESGATKTISWVGKGIVYDTGGLSIKAKTAMPGMKRDCGGAAAILYAFRAAVKLGFTQNLNCLLCLAENSVGPTAIRPDDVLYMYSGRTVEVNNTDAEGRLVLADGVSYAARALMSDVIVDMATLTGAQGVATGKYHAAVLTNSADWELASVRAGRISGDLCHPVPYSPELHFNEFASAVADMKNSVADRGNASVSCAGLFIGAHIGFDFAGTWIHYDMASPVHSGERATGFGVGLLLCVFGEWSMSSMLRSLAPNEVTLPDDVCGDGDVSTQKKLRLV